VRAACDDLLLADLVIVKRFDVLLGEHLEQELVAGTAGRVAGAGFFGAENREIDAGFLQELGGGARDLLGAIVIGRCAADP
jgi:hypothetical protein